MMKTADLQGKWWRLDAAGIVGIALITAAIYFFALKPSLDANADFVLQRAKLSDRKQESTRLAGVLKDQRTQLEKVREVAAASSIQLHPTSHLNERLADITQLATDCGLQVDEIQPASVIRGARYEQVPIQVAGHGQYKTCADFLHKLHAKFPDTGVTTLELDGRSPEAKNRTFRFQLVWFASPSVAATAEAQ
jgi:Tfp pilus assembly protein PilO